MPSKTYQMPNGGWLRPAIAREGRRQRQIRRALIGYGDRPVLTRELAQAAYPRLDVRRLARWQWFDVRQTAERYAVRLEPRTRPLNQNGNERRQDESCNESNAPAFVAHPKTEEAAKYSELHRAAPFASPPAASAGQVATGGDLSIR